MTALGLSDNDYGADGFRTCSVTGLSIHRSAGNMTKLNDSLPSWPC